MNYNRSETIQKLSNYKLTIFPAISAVRCGHTYHFACIQQWIDSGEERRCPICRMKISKKKIINKLYFDEVSQNIYYDALVITYIELRTQNSELRTEVRAQNSELRTQNSEQKSELRIVFNITVKFCTQI